MNPMPKLFRILSFLLFLSQSMSAEADGKAPKRIGWIETVDQQIEGWTVTVDVSLLPGGPNASEGGAALKMLANHLQRIAILLPEEPLAKMRRCGIRIEHQHPELRSMQYHPSAEWLADHGYEPSLAKKVHISGRRSGPMPVGCLPPFPDTKKPPPGRRLEAMSADGDP